MRKFIITILHIIISLPIIALAIDTNINKVTDLFDKYIDNKQELLQNLEEQNNNAINQIKSGTHHDSIEGIGEAGVKAGELGAIKETDLDNAGRSRRASTEYQFYDENELEPDYTKPGNRLHKEDSDDIVSSTDDTMHKIGSNFMAKLNSEGFDCKTVKGSVIKEPTYYIEIKREQQKNTEYDQLFCEEPRNNYNCNDTATLTCVKIVKKFKNPEARKIKLDGHQLHHNKNHWGYAWKWERKRWGWYIHPHHFESFFGLEIPLPDNSAAIIADARAHIANHLGVSIEQIGEHVEFPAYGRGIGNINPVGCRWRVAWDWYEFGYTYREVYHVCEQWAEDWNERCTLK